MSYSARRHSAVHRCVSSISQAARGSPSRGWPVLPGLISHSPAEMSRWSPSRRVDPVAEGFDCVIRVGRVVDESLAARPLGALPLINVVSRGYIEAHGAVSEQVARAMAEGALETTGVAIAIAVTVAGC